MYLVMQNGHSYLLFYVPALLGAAISTFIAMFRAVQSNRRIKELQKGNDNAKEIMIANQQNELAELQKKSGEVYRKKFVLKIF